MQEKLLCINNGEGLYILQGVLELSSALHAFCLHVSPSFQNEISRSLLPEVLLALPSRILPTLLIYNQWLSSLLSRTRSQQIYNKCLSYLQPVQRHGKKYTNRVRWVINRILLNFRFAIRMPSLSLSFPV
jgi:hypothetical protein